MFRVARAVCIVLVLTAPVLRGQTPDTATLKGRITDRSHAAIPGVRVTETNSITGRERSTQADASGGFSFDGLSIAGAYRLTAQKEGFANRTLSDITLTAGTAAELDLELAVSGGWTIVTVVGEAGGVGADEPQLGAALSAPQIEATPLLNHRITYLPLLSSANRPAINQGDVFMNQDLFTTNGTGRRHASRSRASVLHRTAFLKGVSVSSIPQCIIAEQSQRAAQR